MCLAFTPDMRDMENNPYSLEEEKVAKYFVELIGIGGGNDPIESLIASHAELVRQRLELKNKYPEIFKELC